MTKYFIGYTKENNGRADVCAAESIDELTGDEGGYDSADGPFTLHEAYENANEQNGGGDHFDRMVEGCAECEARA